MFSSISNLLTRRETGPLDTGRRDAATVPVDTAPARASLPQDAAAPGCLPGYMRLRRARRPVSAADGEGAAPSPGWQPARHWRTWAQAERASGARCAVAIQRIQAFLDRVAIGADTLDLSGLGLTSLPPHMPATVIHLSLSNNGFSALPPNLPPLLKSLELDHNRLEALSGPFPESLQRLDLSHNRLQSVSDDLPASLTRLNLDHNRIETLPASLPASLQVLQASGNLLRRLPATLPPALIGLDVNANRLDTLPEHWPDSLQVLRADENAICQLPTRWPRGLLDLKARHNRIAELPMNFFRALPHRCDADLRGNLLPPGEQAKVHADCAMRIIHGVHVPTIIVEEPVFLGTVEARPLIVAAAEWYAERTAQVPQAALRLASLQSWASFQDERGAQAFAAFLDGLIQTRNVGVGGFVDKVHTWLGRLAADAALRAASFNEAIGATETCVDRVGLTFNAMKQLEIEHDVKEGRYDADLPQLVWLARATFRLKTLEQIAAELAQDNPAADEISIFLGLQVKLRSPLNLPIEAAKMTFFRLAELEPKHISIAERDVKRAESQRFPAFLAGWAPWQSAIERLDPALHEAAADALSKALETTFETALDARLAPDGLQRDDDARRIAGPAVMAQIAQQIRLSQTERFLAARTQSALLQYPW